MPELPEVETIRRDLSEKIIGTAIGAVNLLNVKSARNEAVFFIESLVGQKFERIGRTGKLLSFKIKPKNKKAEPKYLLIHLKMTGQLIFKNKISQIVGGHSDKKSEQGLSLPNKHTRVIIQFKNGDKLYFNDLRKFGYLKIVSENELNEIIESNYGPEPLSSQLSLEYLSAKIKNRNINMKAFLLNQKIIAGLGNIYVDESLFLARIKPTRLAKSLSSKEIKALYEAINAVIKKAIKFRGTTFNNYVDSAGKRGSFSKLLNVYGRSDKPCPNCNKPLQKMRLAGRGTNFCDYCQK